MNFKCFNKKLIFPSICALSLIFICSFIFITYTKSQESADAELKTIIIDAGHGGEDGGTSTKDGILEKDLNLKIALKLKNFLEASGYSVIMTREKDTAIYDKDSKTLRQKKTSDLKNRLGIVNKSKEQILVSIHQNTFPNEKYFGTQIFYSTNDLKSEELATKIKESVTGLIQPENKREIKPATKNIFLLNNAEIPGVVVECGFLSNDIESKKLQNDKYQNQLAFSVYCGIINYFIN